MIIIFMAHQNAEDKTYNFFRAIPTIQSAIACWIMWKIMIECKKFRFQCESDLYKKLRSGFMRTITLQIDDSISEKFLWLLDRFSRDEIKILEQSDYVSDDEYLRGIEGMIHSIQAARDESIE